MRKLFISFLVLFVAVQASAQTQLPTNKSFYIQSAQKLGSNGGFWDIPGGKNPKLKEGKNIEIWERNGGQDQHFKFVQSNRKGYYEIYVSYGYNFRANVDGGKTNNGTNLELWSNNSNQRQNFKFKHLGNGKFKIYTTSGKVISLKNRNSSNGSNICIWNDQNGNWNEWYLIDTKTNKRYIPESSSFNNANASHSAGKSVYTLKHGEEFVFGKTGVNGAGSVKYNFVVIRKANTSKDIYTDSWREYDFAGVIQGSANLKLAKQKREYMQYDFWVVFNGKKMGPYDAIYEIGQIDPRIDNWISKSGKTICFGGQKQKYYMAVLHNTETQKYFGPYQAPIYDASAKSSTYAMRWQKGDYRLIRDGKHVLQGWRKIDMVRCSSNGNVAFVGNKNGNGHYVYLNQKQIHGPIAPYKRGTIMRTYYQIHPELYLGDDNYLGFSGGSIFYRVNNADGTVTASIGRKSDRFQQKINFDSKTRVSQVYERNGELYFTSFSNNQTTIYKVKGGVMDKGRPLSGFWRIDLDNKQEAMYRNIENGASTYIFANGVARSKSSWQSTKKTKSLRFAPNGDAYVCFSDGYKSYSRILKNNKLHTGIASCKTLFDFKFLNSTNGAVISACTKNGSKKEYALSIGEEVFKSTSRFQLLGVAPRAKAVFTLNNNMFQKNGKQFGTQQFKQAEHFCTNKDGSLSAFLTTSAKEFKIRKLHELHPRNLALATQHTLVVNGATRKGRYGIPVYVPKNNKLVVLQQVGRNIVLTSLK